MSRPVRIVEYDPRWPRLYDEERRHVLERVGTMVVAIEHIGSTAVPGLGGKAILDVMAGVRRSADADECVTRLQDDYPDVTPEPEAPDWYYCLGKPCQSEPAYYVHLHLVRFASDHWARHLLFRDFLRTHPAAAQQYYGLKTELAEMFGADRVGYTDAKTSFITAMIDEARRSRASTTASAGRSSLETPACGSERTT
jgi:GrpB-like predicted nucleotidyltransferase (UPF0157 family)